MPSFMGNKGKGFALSIREEPTAIPVFCVPKSKAMINWGRANGGSVGCGDVKSGMSNLR